MSRRRSPIPLQKHTLNFRAGDFQAITNWCAPRGIVPTDFVRKLISGVVDKLRKEEETAFNFDLSTVLDKEDEFDR